MRYPISLFLISALLLGCGSASLDMLTECVQIGTVQYLSVDESVEIGVYLPPCYDLDLNRVYPVLYMLPGFGGLPNDWFDAGLASIADDLILTRKVPPFLIVTTDDSFEDLDASFIVQQIIPYLEEHYRVSPNRLHRAVAGGSLGAASAYHLAFKIPELFSSAGIFGNGATFGEEDEIRSWLDMISESSPARVFLNCGENDAYMLERAQVMIALLDEAGIEHAEIFDNGNHTYTYWLSNFPTYLRWLARDW